MKIFTKFREKTKFWRKYFFAKIFAKNFYFFFREKFLVKTFVQSFSRKLFSQRYDEKYSANNFRHIFFAKITNIFSWFWRKNLRKCFHGKDFAKKKLKNFHENFRAKKYITIFAKICAIILRNNFAQNFFAIKFATIFFAIINNYTYFLTTLKS